MKDMIRELLTGKGVITIMMLISLLWLPSNVAARPDPPPAGGATCIVVVIGIAVTVTIVYGLYRMCEHIPAANQDPPAQAPISELPGMGPPSYVHVMPPFLKLRDQMIAARVSLQHQDIGRSDWQTDYTFSATENQIGGVAMVAYDSNGLPLVTNDVPLAYVGGEIYAPLMFTNLPPAFTNSPAGRIFRLQGQ